MSELYGRRLILLQLRKIFLGCSQNNVSGILFLLGLGGFMLKLRLQGTTNDLKWFRKLLERDRRIQVLTISDAYKNKGTNKCYRVYAEGR